MGVQNIGKFAPLRQRKAYIAQGRESGTKIEEGKLQSPLEWFESPLEFAGNKVQAKCLRLKEQLGARK